MTQFISKHKLQDNMEMKLRLSMLGAYEVWMPLNPA